MTTQFLLSDLKSDEGLRLVAYPDPISGGEPITIGYGHTGGVVAGTKWTQEQCDAELVADELAAETELDKHVPWWRSLNDVRQDCLANMCFNLGWPRLSAFHNFLTAAKAGDYGTAANEMLDSAWARQVHSRATRLAEQMRTGVRA